MNIVRRLSLVAVLIGALTAGCTRHAEMSTPIKTIADLKGRRCGTVAGWALQEKLEAMQEGISFSVFNDAPSMIEALRLGKIDAVPLDTVILRRWAAKCPGEFEVVARFADDPFGYIFPKGSPLCERVNRVLVRMKEKGEIDRIVSKWCTAQDLNKVQAEPFPHKEGHTGKNGVLRFSTWAGVEPASFIRNGEVVGFDVDLARWIACELDMGFSLLEVSGDAFVTAVQSGKADMGGNCISITDVRRQAVDFSECYLNDGFSLLVKAAPLSGVGRETGVAAFARSLRNSFVRTFVSENRWKMLASGLGMTLTITMLATLLGTVLAFPVWLARTSRRKPIAYCARAYIALLQGTPVLVLLMILFYIVFGNLDIDGLWIAVIGFGLNLSAYAGEMLRSGVNSVPRGQTEAALALGYTPVQAFVHFVLPQAVRTVLPVYRGELIGLLKMTSIVGYIAIADLTKASDLIRSRTYESFFPIITTAVIYFVVSWLLAFALDRLGRRFTPVSTRTQKKGGAQ